MYISIEYPYVITLYNFLDSGNVYEIFGEKANFRIPCVRTIITNYKIVYRVSSIALDSLYSVQLFSLKKKNVHQYIYVNGKYEEVIQT